uniref:Oxidoreductase, acting on the CH-CH group of donors n=1 Tax=Solanum tuberosum TaxID=4113 RepID=M1A491_SOLTU
MESNCRIRDPKCCWPDRILSSNIGLNFELEIHIPDNKSPIVELGYQLTFFIITALFRFDKVTDFAGGTNFIILAILTLVLKGSWHFRQVVLSLFVVIWGLRLGLFLLMRILQWGEDRRFDDIRDNLGKLAIAWILQAIWVWTVSLPVTVVNASDKQPSVQTQDIIGWIMWIIGILVEITADQQKLAFKNSPENRGKWCSVGLWKYSRHPNYFGELFARINFYLDDIVVELIRNFCCLQGIDKTSKEAVEQTRR